MKRAAGYLALALALVVTPGEAKAPGGSLLLRYEAFAAGFPVVAFDFRLDETGSAYSVDGNIRTVGVLRLFYRVDVSALSQGVIASGAMEPHIHEQVLKSKGGDRVARLEYPGDGTVSARLMPPEDSGRPKPTPQQVVHTIDPLSAVLAIGHAAARAGRCDGRFAVFDGRRRYDIILTDDGSERFEPSSAYGYVGMARRCRADAVKIAGFSFDQDYQPHINKGWVWLAAPRAGAPALPVRIDFDGTWGLVEVRMIKIE